MICSANPFHKLPEELEWFMRPYIGPAHSRSYKTACKQFNLEDEPQKGILTLPNDLLIEIVSYFEGPNEDRVFRGLCVRLEQIFSRKIHLNLDNALSYCHQHSCTKPKHLFSHSLGFNRLMAKYIRFECRIVRLNALNHGFTDDDLAKLKDQPIEELNITGYKVTAVGMKIIAKFPSLKKLRFDGLQKADRYLRYFKKMQLQSLSFSSPDVTDLALEHLKNVPLQQLKIEGYSWDALVNGWGLEFLSTVPLKDLEIVKSYFSPRYLRYLKAPLQRLVLKNPLPFLTPGHLQELKARISTLQVVQLNGMPI